jgi:hypothetical protein
MSCGRQIVFGAKTAAAIPVVVHSGDRNAHDLCCAPAFFQNADKMVSERS